MSINQASSGPARAPPAVAAFLPKFPFFQQKTSISINRHQFSTISLESNFSYFLKTEQKQNKNRTEPGTTSKRNHIQNPSR